MSRLSEIAEKIEGKSKAAWSSIVTAARMKALPEQGDELDTIEDDEVIGSVLALWVRERACTDTFLPLLDSMIVEANEKAHMNIGNQLTTSYALGAEGALRQLSKQFHTWRNEQVG